MVRQIAKGVVELLRSVSGAEYSERSHQVELIGTYLDNDGKNKDVICTVQMKHYIPREEFGEGGYFYNKKRQRKVRNKDRKWVIIDETVTLYEMSEADKKFIYVNYVHKHLDQRQLSKVSGIPQPYVYRYIKHMKLKPKYPNTIRSERNKEILNELGLDMAVKTEYNEYNEKKVELPEDADIDFEKPFHVDPFPCRSEWKVRREKLGLKNGEDWRNHNDADGEITAKEYGDGSTVRRKKVAKQKRKEKRKIKNISKYNLHQNNRYGMTLENPEGDLSKRKFPEENVQRKRYIGNGKVNNNRKSDK